MTDSAPHVFVLAGEPSGDLLGGRLMVAIRRIGPVGVRFSGVGGESMTAQGLVSLFPMAELSLFGVFEIIPKIPGLLRRIEETARAVAAARPDVVVTIDSPGFNARVARRVRELAPEIPLVHYVAPTVWAWKPHRAKRYARLFDHLLALLPFEPPYFTREGLDCSFVGHSVVEGGAGRGDGTAFRTRHGVAADERILVMLPGSRRGEVDRLMPVFAETLALLRESHGEGLVVVIPAVAAQRDRIASAIADWPGRVLMVSGDAEKFDAFAAAELALAASGTVALELALARLPAVITYRLHPLTVCLYQRFIKVRYANLVNLMLDRMLVPELLQEDCRPESLHRALVSLLDDPVARDAQVAGVSEVAAWLGDGGVPPSERAARRVLAVAGKMETGNDDE